MSLKKIFSYLLSRKIKKNEKMKTEKIILKSARTIEKKRPSKQNRGSQLDQQIQLLHPVNNSHGSSLVIHETGLLFQVIPPTTVEPRDNVPAYYGIPPITDTHSLYYNRFSFIFLYGNNRGI